MKTVYVRAKTKDEARKRAEWLYMILRDCTPVIADLCTSKAQVVTESMVIKYVPEGHMCFMDVLVIPPLHDSDSPV